MTTRTVRRRRRLQRGEMSNDRHHYDLVHIMAPPDVTVVRRPCDIGGSEAARSASGVLQSLSLQNIDRCAPMTTTLLTYNTLAPFGKEWNESSSS